MKNVLSFWSYRTASQALNFFALVAIVRLLEEDMYGRIVVITAISGLFENSLSFIFSDDFYSNVSKQNLWHAIRRIRRLEILIFGLLSIPLLVWIHNSFKEIPILTLLAFTPLFYSGLGPTKNGYIIIAKQKEFSKIEFTAGLLRQSVIILATLIFGIFGFVIASLISMLIIQFYYSKNLKKFHDPKIFNSLTFRFLRLKIHERFAIITRSIFTSLSTNFDILILNISTNTTFIANYKLLKSLFSINGRILAPLIQFDEAKIFSNLKEYRNFELIKKRLFPFLIFSVLTITPVYLFQGILLKSIFNINHVINIEWSLLLGIGILVDHFVRNYFRILNSTYSNKVLILFITIIPTIIGSITIALWPLNIGIIFLSVAMSNLILQSILLYKYEKYTSTIPD